MTRNALGAFKRGEVGEGSVGCGTIPEIIQSSWKAAVTSAYRGGSEDGPATDRGRARIRATLI